jgi:hypothetical protein
MWKFWMMRLHETEKGKNHWHKKNSILNEPTQWTEVYNEMDEVGQRSIELDVQDMCVLYTLNQTYTKAWISLCFLYLITEIQKTNTQK